MSYVKQANDQSFQDRVQNNQGLVLVDFYADWCGPCQAQAPILESFASENASALEVVKVDVDAAPNVAQSYGIRSIPTLALFLNGEVVERRVGTSSAIELQELVDSHTH